MPRFVLLQHDVGSQLQRTQQRHFDWMFEVDGALRSFATDVIHPLDKMIEVDAQSLADHRIEYLDHEGEVSGQRGRVRRLIGGTYDAVQQGDQEFSAQIHWTEGHDKRTAQVTFYRILMDSWSLLFIP